MITLPHLDKKNPLFWLIAIFILVIFITSLDILSGYELSFSLFYLLPVVLSARIVSKRTGILMPAICAIVNPSKNNLREIDIVARLGGNEFAFQLSNTEQADTRIA